MLSEHGSTMFYEYAPSVQHACAGRGARKKDVARRVMAAGAAMLPRFCRVRVPERPIAMQAPR